MIYIPLGAGCYVTECLKLIDKRYKAFPFDWCIVDFKYIHNILDHIITDYKDFTNFLFSDIRRCKWVELEQYVEIESGPAYHCGYNLIFPHHDIINNREIISKRIERLNNVLKYDEYKLLVFDKFCDKKYSYDDIEYNNNYFDDITKLKFEYDIISASSRFNADIKFECNDNWRVVAEQLSKGFVEYEKINNI